MSGPVAVVIPVFNQGHLVGRAIESVLAQTFAPVEVVVVDDGSTDDTADVIRRFVPAVRLVTQPNRGVAAARNAGAAASTAPLLAFLDADDTWLDAKLERQLMRWRSDPELGFVYCGLERVDPRGARLSLDVEGLDGWAAERIFLLQSPGVPAGGSTPLVSRAVFEGVGGFDERLSTAADWELCLRIASIRPVGFVPEPLVRYTVREDGMHRDLAAMEHDVLLGYEKALASDPARWAPLRPRAVANLYTILARSYGAGGDIRRACRALALAARHRPASLVSALVPPRLGSRAAARHSRSGP